MIVGVISDTHDNASAIKKGIEIFNRRQADLLIHLGDIVAPFSALLLGAFNGEIRAVYGNNDGERAGLAELFAKNGWILRDRPDLFEYQGRLIAALHEPDHIERYARRDDVDLILYGHTHKAKIERRDSKLIFNPGEGGGWTTGSATVGLIDLDDLEAEIVNL